METNAPNKYSVQIPNGRHIVPFDETTDAAECYEYMRNFAAWLINGSNASADLKARVNLFYTDLETAYVNYATKKFSDLPAYSTYTELVDRYNAEDIEAPASAVVDRNSTNGQPVVQKSPPVTPTDPAPVAEPVVATAPASEPAPTNDTPPAPQPTAAPVQAARFVPPAPPSGEPTNADLMAVLQGIPPILDDHADLLDEHGRRIEAIENALPRANDGSLLHHSSWADRTVTVAGRKFRYLLAVAAFVFAYVLLLLFLAPTWPDTGFWFSLSDWRKLLIAAIVFLVTLVLTNRNTSQTASAA